QASPVAAAANGDFVVAWHSYSQDGSSYGVFGQRFSTSVVASCEPSPLGSCAMPGKSQLIIDDVSPAGGSLGDKLLWKWLKGPAAMQSNFGDPTLTAQYKLCVYTGGGQALTISAGVGAGPSWSAISTKGYKYKESTGSAAGISKILLKGGGDGETKILI